MTWNTLTICAVSGSNLEAHLWWRNSNVEGINSRLVFPDISTWLHKSRLICPNWQDAGTEIDPMGDLNTDAEKKLGQLVKEK